MERGTKRSTAASNQVSTQPGAEFGKKRRRNRSAKRAAAKANPESNEANAAWCAHVREKKLEWAMQLSKLYGELPSHLTIEQLTKKVVKQAKHAFNSGATFSMQGEAFKAAASAGMHEVCLFVDGIINVVPLANPWVVCSINYQTTY